MTSKTREVCEYTGKLKYDDAIYNIIDTPGFYDSDNEDNKHINNIINFIKNLKEFGGINCIFYFISLQEQRFDHTIHTCLSLLRSLLGDDVFKMIKIIYTHKNDLSQKAYVKALDRFKDLPQLLISSGFPVNENLERFIFDYDKPEDFCMEIIACTKKSPKFYPEVLDHLENINFDLTDPVKVYKSLLDNSKCIASLNDQLNKLEDVIKNYEKQCSKFEDEKKLFAEELRRKEEEVKKLIEAQSIASKENKNEITRMIQEYSSQIDKITKNHNDNLHALRIANEVENKKILDSQEKYRIDQERIRQESEEKIRKQYIDDQAKMQEQLNILDQQNKELRSTRHRKKRWPPCINF